MGFYKRIGSPFYGMYHDFRTRIPYYKSDFVDAYNYRVIPSTVFIFFTNLLPAIAFAQDMFDATNNSYGLNEVLISTAVGGVAFGLFAGQPLIITGVTGPIAIFSNTVYDLLKDKPDTPYFAFMAWLYIWSMIFHLIIAVFNWVAWLRIISSFSCDAFGFFINFVYITKGIEILSRQFEVDQASGYASIMVAFLMLIFGCGSYYFGNYCLLLGPHVRKAFMDYGLPLCVIFFTGFIHFGGQLNLTDFATLPTSALFKPTDATRGGWFIKFWDIPVGDVFLAIPFAILLTFLFYFDHNVSALMCQTRDYPLKKPPSFHWDFALLGITTGVAGLFGFPAPNGLIPQAPLHTHSLAVFDKYGNPISMVEQRVTNTAQGLITFVMMTKPFLVVLGLIPQAILSGLFFAMGFIGLHESIVTNRIRYILTDKEYRSKEFPDIYKLVNKLDNYKWFILYTFLEAFIGLCEYAITVTPGAIGFPIVLFISMICAKWIWPLFIPRSQLDLLDESIVEPAIMESLMLTKKFGKNNVESDEIEIGDLESSKDL